MLIDISASLTTNGMTRRLHQKGELLAQPWLLDPEGNPTRDPGVLFSKPAGTILPLGVIEAGHKVYGLTLLVEMLTGGLAGLGRADPAMGPGATVFLQLIDAGALGGGDEFRHQMQWIADACRASPTRPGVDQVRMPGEGGLRKSREQLTEGAMLSETIVQALESWTKKLGVALPHPALGHDLN